MLWYSRTQFALFRIIFGTYLFVHFYDLLNVSVELFSSEGVIPDSTKLPTFNKYMWIFNNDDPSSIKLLIKILITSSLFFTFGYLRRIASAILYCGWVFLLNRNPLISNPSLGYIGWLLLACVLIPTGDRLGFLMTEVERKQELEKNPRRWELSNICYYGMWAILGVSYTASGIHKLQCESWRDGTALYWVLTGPLVRNVWIIEYIVKNHLIIKLLSWSSLFLEISWMFFGMFYHTRKTFWILTMGFHLGILFTINFTDLTLGMLIPHIFTFDASWFTITKNIVKKYDWYDNVYKIDEDNRYVYNKTYNKNNSNNSSEQKSSTVSSNQNDKIRIKSSRSLKNLPNYDTEYEDTDKLSKKCSSPIDKWNILTILSVIIGIGINTTTANFILYIKHLGRLMFEMYWGFTFMIIMLGFFMIMERIFPDKKLPRVNGWWKWVIIINLFQLFAVILATFTWETALQSRVSYLYGSAGSLHLRKYVNPMIGGLIAYMLSTWVFYWWHKARHEIYILWILFHQFHHSPSRIETITSFYKHPLEIIVDSQIMSLIIYAFLGLDKESSIWVSLFAGFGEYFYHMNISTPWTIGYIFQRPESHRLHHRYNKRLHCPNYADIPLWDILGGTFENPPNNFTESENNSQETGFYSEEKRIEMLCFKDVLFTKTRQNIFKNYRKFSMSSRRFLMYLLSLWGILNSIGYITHFDSIKPLGFVSVSSPLPLVFSAYNGVETYSTKFDVEIKYQNQTIINTELDQPKYNLMTGAYNRRNIYGAIFSHGAFFDDPKMIEIRQQILNYAICYPGKIIDEMKLSGNVQYIKIDIINRITNQIIGKLYKNCLD